MTTYSVIRVLKDRNNKNVGLKTSDNRYWTIDQVDESIQRGDQFEIGLDPFKSRVIIVERISEHGALAAAAANLPPFVKHLRSTRDNFISNNIDSLPNELAPWC